MEQYYPRDLFNDHKVKVTLQYKRYKAELIAYMGGNCRGVSILHSIVSSMEDGDIEFPTSEELNKKHITFEDPDCKYSYAKYFRLIRDDGADGAEYFINGEDEDLKDYVVAVEIVECTPEKR